MKFTAFAAVAALALGATVSLPAHATLIITANGTVVATDPTNTVATFSGAVDGFNINRISVTGVNAFGGNGELVDTGTLDISTLGTGALTIIATETNLTQVGLLAGAFTGLLTNATVSKAEYLDTTNQGLMTTLIGSTSIMNGTYSFLNAASTAFSLTEVITVTATGAGATLSSDDNTTGPVRVAVPEPMSLALLGSSLFGIGALARRSDRNNG